MPAEYLHGPASVLQLEVCDGCPSGDYLAVGALFAPRTMDTIGEMSIAAFSISD